MTRKTTLLLLLLCMSYNAFAQCYSSSRTSNYTIIARQTDGTLWGKGYNQRATMGDGTTTTSGTFVQIGTGNNWTDNYSISYSHALAIKTDGTLWVWGEDHGQLGIPTSATTNTGVPVLPTQVGTSNNWTAVACGLGHSLAIKSDGTLWAWGANQEGQLGIGVGIAGQATPIQVGTANNWLKVFANDFYSFAIKTDGTLWSWGQGGSGVGIADALGYIGLPNDYLSPHQVGTATNWTTASISSSVAMGIKSDGTLWVWGRSNYGQFGNGTPIGTFYENLLPTQLGTDTNWKDINLSALPSCMALKTNGTRWGWGDNNYYSLGNGTTNYIVPTPLDTATDWGSIDLDNFQRGGGSSIKQNNSLFRWGYDSLLATNLQVPTLQGNSCTLSSTTSNYENNVHVYPNPVDNTATVNFTLQETGVVNYVITNTLGQVVYKSEQEYSISDNQIKIDFSDYASGVYLISLFSQTNHYSTKIMKQ
jgi:Secretion system C-terminal sorting domain/Regulator of chromosome condensation (RCC1) repeat